METNSNDLQSDRYLDDLSDDVGDLLRQVAHFSIPDGFLTETLSLFDAAMTETASRRQNWLALWVAVIAVLSVAATILWLIILNITLVTKAAAAVSQIGMLTLQYLLEMWSMMPELGTGLMLGLWTIMFVCAAMLVKAFRVVGIHHSTVG